MANLIHRKLSCLALTLIMTSSFIHAADHAHEIGELFTTSISADSPGAAVLVISHGKPVFERGYGIADLKSHRRIDEHTNFRLASVTKQFTAMAVMLLVKDGKLRYEDRLAGIFPDFPAYGNGITIRNLLNHTSGLLDYEDLMAAPDPAKPLEEQQITDVEVLKLMKQQSRTKFAPATKWDYSNSGYVVLGTVVEKVSGKPFGQFLHDRIFEPLHMRNTVAYERGKNLVRHRAYGYDKAGNDWQLHDQSTTSATLGDGGVYTSLDDLLKWDAALRNHTLLSENEMRPALTPVQAPGVEEPEGKPAQYGFGWFLNPYKGHRRMWHYGETVGFRTAIQRFPDDNLSIVVLCNRSDLNAISLSLKIADLYLK
jgi:CubicO group peptidase (beta-lactamase class C family)